MVSPWSSLRPAVLLGLALAAHACGDGTAASPDATDTGDADGDVREVLPGPGCEGPVAYGEGALPQPRPGLVGVPTAEDFATSLCASFCTMAARCGDTFTADGSCAATCARMVADGHQNNVACYLADCRQRDACLADAPIAELAGCPQICDEIAGCPGLSVLRLTPEPAACRTLCAGRAAAIPTFRDALSCMGPIAGQCDVDAVLDCLRSGANFCPALCTQVGSCAANTPFGALYPDRASCFAECEAKTPAMAWKALACFDRDGCQADRACTQETPARCEDYFVAAATVCSARDSWPPSFGLLAATCDPTRFQGVESVTGVPACLQSTSCEALESRVCLSEHVADPRCPALCDDLCDCGLLTMGECLFGCTDPKGAADGTIDAVAACVESRDCAQIAACFATIYAVESPGP